MAKKKNSFMKRFVAFIMTLAIFGGVFYYLYEYTDVLSKLLGKKYDITFIVDGKEYNKQVTYDTLPKFDETPTKKPTTTIEYVFDGWEPALKNVDGDATYTAKFKEQERLYNVSVVSNYDNGGSFSGNGKVYSYLSDGSVSVTVNNGYIFEGWYVDDVLKTTELTFDFEDIDADFELEAKFSTIKKSITYNNLKEATNTNPEEYDVTFGVFGLKPIKTEGYRFVGWYTGVDGTGDKIETIDSSLLQDYVLYAHWSLEATLTLNVDGKNLKPITTYVGEVISKETINSNFNSTEFGMSGYSVKKWYTDSALTDEYDFSNEVEDNFTLYGEFDYFMDETYFYPYLNKFNSALNSQSMTIYSRDELVAYIDFVRFYDVSKKVNFRLDYLDGSGQTVLDEIDYAYELLLEKTSFETTTVFTYWANGYTGSFYAKTSSWGSDATLSADSEKQYIFEQKDYAMKIVNDDARAETFDDFNLNNVKQEISVSTSEQLVHVLQSGYKPKAVSGSRAESVLNKAKEILVEICNDDMTEFEKLRAIYEWLVLNVEYDNRALEMSETLSSSELKKYKAWYAEGVFDDGVAVCEGYAKAFIIMAKLENIPAIMVSGDGHAWNKVLYNGKWYGVDATHGSPSLQVSASEVFEILTYNQFMFSDEFKTATGYTADNYTLFVAEESSMFNVYDAMDYSHELQSFDLFIGSLNELVLLFEYIDLYITTANIDYATFEIAIDDGFNLQNNLTLANMQAQTNVGLLFNDLDSLNNITYHLKITA